ncbi:MAG: wax ester/triacylglycerol synthase family O-acyltransferase [Sandaracinaceae bacterium]
MTHYERLTGLDQSFLDIEGPSSHMHVAFIGTYQAAPLRGSDGAIDLDRLMAYVESRLHRIPRYRQRIERTPFEGCPVWVDDESFNLRYHLRHTGLPAPGDERQLKRLCGRILSQKLDRHKPLWEMWLVEGLEGDRLAVITKTHHCMVDGASGTHLLLELLSTSPEPAIEEAPPWRPEHPPSRLELIQKAIEHRIQRPLAALRRTARAAYEHPGETIERVTATASAARHALEAWARTSSPTPFNRPIGPHRRLDWLRMDLREIKRSKQALGGTVNDIILAIVGGAIGRYFRSLGSSQADLEAMRFRVFCPVSMRHQDESGDWGNRVVMVVTDLPIHLEDPVERLAVVRRNMDEIKASHQAEGADLAVTLGEWSSPTMVAWAVQASYERLPANMLVTNVPGPQVPLYLLGSRMLEAYPVVPLYRNHALGIALFSYDGGIFFGFNSDWDALPDLHDLIVHTLEVRRAFSAAATQAAPTAHEGARGGA